MALLQKRTGDADALLDQAVKIFREIGDRYSVAAQIGNYGWTLLDAGRPGEARPYLLRAAELFDEVGWADHADPDRRAARGAVLARIAKDVREGRRSRTLSPPPEALIRKDRER